MNAYARNVIRQPYHFAPFIQAVKILFQVELQVHWPVLEGIQFKTPSSPSLPDIVNFFV